MENVTKRNFADAQKSYKVSLLNSINAQLKILTDWCKIWYEIHKEYNLYFA